MAEQYLTDRETSLVQLISNPIIKGFNPDPVICRQGDDYYIATSTFEWFPGVRIYHSKNMQDWKLVAQPLDRVSQLDMKGIPNSGGVWAPCLTHHDGLFWLVYSNVKSVESPWKCGDNFLVTAPEIEGPWSEPIQLPFAGFDPSLFHDASGRKYITYREWGPRHHSNPHNHIVLQEYFHDTRSLSEKSSIIFTGTQRKLTEAPHIYQVGGYYYLFVAEGGTAYDHAVTVLRSNELGGPYELHPDETILTSAHMPEHVLQKAGHGAILQTHNGEWYMVFLVGRPIKSKTQTAQESAMGYCPLGRETAIDKIEWRDNWPHVVGGQHAKSSIPAPEFSTTNDTPNETFIDRFNTSKLDAEWQTLRVPFSDELGEISPDNKCLRLFGREPLISQFTQATVGHRWKHFQFDAITNLSFKPVNPQQNAGIACYYNTQNWIYCFIDFDSDLGSRSLKIIQLDNNEAKYFLYDSPIPLPASQDSVSLKVSVRAQTLSFSYALDGENWCPIDLSFEAWKLSDDYVKGKGFFTGAFICLHCSDLSNRGIHADFHHFEYLPLTSRDHLTKEIDHDRT